MCADMLCLYVPGICVQPAGNVQCKYHGCPRIEERGPCIVGLCQWACNADAKHCINSKITGCRRSCGKLDARVASLLKCHVRVRAVIGFQGNGADHDTLTVRGEPCCRLESVAAIVARTTCHPDAPRMGCQRHRKPRARNTGALHQAGSVCGRVVFQ